MTTLLQRAIAETQNLPSEEQDSIASQILEELADERKWSAQFQATTDEQWNKLTEKARKEIRDGNSIPFEKVFPSDNAQ
jgi:D-ribose pyranose/furanose isomerase RbsD